MLVKLDNDMLSCVTIHTIIISCIDLNPSNKCCGAKLSMVLSLFKWQE